MQAKSQFIKVKRLETQEGGEMELEDVDEAEIRGVVSAEAQKEELQVNLNFSEASATAVEAL